MSGEVTPTDVHSIKEGNYVVFGGAPCVVKVITFSAPGKHGHAKFRIEAIGVFDGKKRIEVITGKSRVDVPIIEKKNAQVLSIGGNKVQVMDSESYENFELEMPTEEELKSKIKEGAEVQYWDVMGMKQIKGVK
ncbi:Translation initiation factor 5A [Candidatus Tiddalikarchaeum anstoanum]|nr:Translation initiation factor 5A [Candidatus Tiddalikarchaeum anstoanum]